MMKKLESPDDTMSFFEHLEELRSRLIRAIIALVIGFLVCIPFRFEIFDFIAAPFPEDEQLAFTRLQEPFLVYLKVSFLAGIFIAAPFVLYQLWRFIAPGLYRKERRYAIPFILGTSFFFILGGAFGYTTVFPVACKFFLTQGQHLKQMVTIQEYFSLCSRTILALALVFEMPVVAAFLAKLQIVSHRFLLRKAKYAVLVNFVLAAIITPTQDMVTQTIVAVPMTGLYFFSILVAWIFAGAEKEQEVPEQTPMEKKN